MQTIKILELFSGYGGAHFALKKAGINVECIGYSDIEDCANYIYAINHGWNIKRLYDITKIDEKTLPDFDLLTGGFPCQSFSLAGKREGFAAANKGKLFFEIIRIAEFKKPRWMLLENVEGLINHDNGRTLQVILKELKRIGYYVRLEKHYSKDHGTPQNRPRVWFVCFREQLDANKFIFPETEKLKTTVKDLLEKQVDKKYYLTEEHLKKFKEHAIKQKEKGNTFANIEQNVNSYCQTICSGSNHYFKIADYRNDEGVRIRKDNICPTIMARSQEDIYSQPIINTITTSYGRQGSSKEYINITKQINQHTNKWRRLTPRECFRLQGFFNDNIKFGNLTDSRLYFLAGNGWDINVASKIFKQMFFGNTNKQKGMGDFI